MSQTAACPLSGGCGNPVICVIGILVVIGIVLFFVGKKKGWSCCGTGGNKAKEVYEEKKKDLDA